MPTSKSKSPSEFEQQVAASSSSTQEFKLATPPSTGTGVARATAVASPLSYYTSSQKFRKQDSFLHHNKYHLEDDLIFEGLRVMEQTFIQIAASSFYVLWSNIVLAEA